MGLRMGYALRVSPYLSFDVKKNIILSVLIFSFFCQPQVRVCMCVPLYHCFGSVLGGVSLAVHGTTLVFPSTSYDSRANLEAIQNEK